MSPGDDERYSRQILFAPLGREGQRRLLASRAAVVGCGALGSFHAEALARAGVGEIVLVDRDYVEPSNLQRQWLYDERDAEEALPKAIAAERKLSAINSGVRAFARVTDLTAGNIDELLADVDVVLDGTDNFETRYLINEWAVRERTPWIYGAAVGSYGAVMPILPGESACLACLFPSAPAGDQPTCETAGILNAAAAAVAALQTAEALKILSGRRDAVEPRLLTIDVWQGVPRAIGSARPDPDCAVCARGEYPRLSAGGRVPAAVLCGRGAVQVRGAGAVDLARLAAALAPLGQVRGNEYAVRFVKPPHEMTVFADGRAIVKGVDDTASARALYARYVGG
jgi:molybdopterin-synthase adenylyltransferase